MPKLSPVARRVRRFPSTFVALAAALLVAAGCESSTGNDNSIAALYVTPPSPILTVGQLRQMVATPTNSDGDIVDGQTVSWSTSAAGVATVDANGLVTGVAGGTAEITATVGGETASATVTVWYNTTAVNLSVAAPATTTIRQEGSVQVNASFTDSNGGTSTGRQLLWTSSDPTVATVSQTGRVNGLGLDGTSTITARSNEGVEGTILITVNGSPVVATVTVSPATSVLGSGTTFQMTRSARAASGTVIPGVVTTWSSSAASAAIDPATGLVTGGAAGTATITATAEGVSGTATVITLANAPAGATNVPTIADGALEDYALMVPADVDSVRVVLSGATSGDADLYLYAPGVTPGAAPGYTGFTCRPFLVGSNETCRVTDPAMGGWRIRLHAYPDEGDVVDMVMTVTFFTTP